MNDIESIKYRGIYQDDTSDVSGNCHQCCVATLFAVPLEEIPNFVLDGNDNGDGGGWRKRYIDFMHDEGYIVIFVPIQRKENLDEFLRCNPHLTCFCLLAVKSFHHYNKHHCVVGRIDKGKIFVEFDPNRNNADRDQSEYEIVTIDLFQEI